MLQCESSPMGAAAALHLHLLCRMLRAGEVLALVALVSWSTSYVPSAAAAVLRLAGSLLLNARFVFVLGNAIVVLLFALSRHEERDLSSASSSSNEQHAPSSSTASAAATTANPPAPQQASSSSLLPVAGGGASFALSSYTTTPVVVNTLLPASSSRSMGGATPADPPPPATEDEAREICPAHVLLDQAPVRRLSTLLFEEDTQPAPAVHVTSKSRAPRRSRSEKMRHHHRAASPELRRCESENGRRTGSSSSRRRSSVSARDAEACSWGREDADEFRRQVEAFIARQTRFHHEESIKTMMAGRHCDPGPAFTGALAVVE